MVIEEGIQYFPTERHVKTDDIYLAKEFETEAKALEFGNEAGWLEEGYIPIDEG